MYRGMRDVPLSIRVKQAYCFERIINGVTWIEVCIPDATQPIFRAVPGEGIRTVWKSFMVSPGQVYYEDNTYNVVTGINANTRITVVSHLFRESDGKYLMIDHTTEEIDPFEVMRRMRRAACWRNDDLSTGTPTPNL